MDVTATFSAVLFLMLFSCAGAYDPLDPTGNVTMKWDIMFWTTDGYIAIVILNNFQTFRHFMKPGWTIGPTKLVPSNRFLTPDGPRRTKALIHGKKKPKLLGLSQLSTIRYSFPAQLVLAVAKTVTLVASNAAIPLPPIDFNESQISDFY
ncbi:hypothetical protein H0E87_028151 [Populus deltoides]|uniref:Uncharacterized protein n=1 Tax=Populus deltoides TaxID=3696 RepID=A0A8T2WU30_POPDE|nr:hypothetical protein H0E87_028151 [Populus deltoides]